MKKGGFRVAEDFEIDAQWWIPGKRRSPVSGRLSYSPHSGLDLVLNGALRDGEDEVEIDALLGISAEGDHLSLLRAFCTAKGRSIPGFAVESYTAIYLVVGPRHIRSVGAVRVRAVQVELSGLADWVQYDPVTFDDGPPQTATIVPWKGRTVNIPARGLSVRLASVQNTNHTYNHSLDTRQVFRMQVASARRRGLDWSIEQVFWLRAFVTLLLGHQINVNRVELLGEDRYTDLGDGTSRVDRDDFELVVVGLPPSKESRVHPGFLFVKYAALGVGFDAVVTEWFTRARDLSSTVALFMGATYGERIVAESTFLSLTQALEGLHRRRHGGRYVSGAKYRSVAKKMRDAIPAAVPPDLTTALKKRIEYGNEYSLRKRLNELRRLLPAAHQAAFPKTYIDILISTRNFITHCLRKKTEPIVEGSRLVRATERLRAVLHVLLLQEMKVDSAAIDGLVTTNLVFRRLMFQKADEVKK